MTNNKIYDCYSDTPSKTHYGIYGVNSSMCSAIGNSIYGNSSDYTSVNAGISGIDITDGNFVTYCHLGLDDCRNANSNWVTNCNLGMDDMYRACGNYVYFYTTPLQPGGSEQYLGISCTYGQLEGNRITQSGSTTNITTNGDINVVDTSAYSTVSGTYIEVYTATRGIKSNHSCTITGNTILKLGSKRNAGLTASMYGIWVNGGTVGSTTIIGNCINQLQSPDVGAIGIVISAGERCSIVGNTIGGPAWGGNWATNSAFNIAGSQHIVSGNNLGGRGYTDSSSGSTIVSNNA